MNNVGHKTTQAHWDGAWSAPIRQRLPSRLNVGILNITRLLAAHVSRECRYLEIGCAPGKLLAWVAAARGAKCCGLDYSETGVANCRALFAALGLDIELHHADFFDHDLGEECFDVVASFGFIEHFDDPAPVVAQHLELVKPGGTLLIAIPNYGRGVYGRLQAWCDPENLSLHNVAIMNTRTLTSLVDESQCSSVAAYRYGNIDPWLLNLHKRLPNALARIVSFAVNSLGILQPVYIAGIAPLLVLEARKVIAR